MKKIVKKLIIFTLIIISIILLLLLLHFIWEKENGELNAYESDYVLIDYNYFLLINNGYVDDIYRYSVDGKSMYLIGKQKGFMIIDLDTGNIIKQSRDIVEFSIEEREYFKQKYLFRYENLSALKNEQDIIGGENKDSISLRDSKFDYEDFETCSYYIENNYMLITECGTKPEWGGNYHDVVPMIGWKQDDPYYGYIGDPIVEHVTMLDWNESYIGLKTEFLGEEKYYILDTVEKKILFEGSNVINFNEMGVSLFGRKFNLKSIEQQAGRAREESY